MSPNSLMRKIRGEAGARWLLVPALALPLLAAGCDNEVADNSASNTYTFVVEMRGEQGNDVFSDVCISTLANPEICTVTNDNAIVTMLAEAKNQSALVDFNGLNDVFFTRYRVTFIRSDGRNVPGVDVPYPFDGATNFRVPVAGQSNEHAFMVVRHQAKLEPPLSGLAEGGASLVLSTIGQVEFFGHDGAGRQIKVTGFINITFGDFPDET